MYPNFSELGVKKDSPKRILLDTNVWRYAVDEKLAGRLVAFARRRKVHIQIAPAVIYETLRQKKDVNKRDQIVSIMTNTHFTRLMPEVYSESMEILSEIRRVSPEFLRKNPDLNKFERLKNDWTHKVSGFWSRCKSDVPSEAHFVSALHDDLFEEAREQTSLARHEMNAYGIKERPPLRGLMAQPKQRIEGWNGNPVEVWRLESLKSVTYHLGLGEGAYHDWLSPFIIIDREILSSRKWGAFWLHISDRKKLPRQWLRWAHSFSQRFRKVTSGSPGDNQLFTYLLETDVVITGDKAFLDILEACRSDSPCALPEGKRISANREGTLALIEYLTAEESTRR
jgi:hypothetical protein